MLLTRNWYFQRLTEFALFSIKKWNLSTRFKTLFSWILFRFFYIKSTFWENLWLFSDLSKFFIMFWLLVSAQPRFESQPCNFSKTPFCDSFFASSDFNFSFSSVRNTRLKTELTFWALWTTDFKLVESNRIESKRIKVTYDPFLAPNGFFSIAFSTPLIALQKPIDFMNIS